MTDMSLNIFHQKLLKVLSVETNCILTVNSIAALNVCFVCSVVCAEGKYNTSRELLLGV